MSCITGIQGSRGPSGPQGPAGINPLDTQIISDNVHYVSIADITPLDIVGSMKYEFMTLQDGLNTAWTGTYPEIRGDSTYGIGRVVVTDSIGSVSQTTLKRLAVEMDTSASGGGEFTLIHVVRDGGGGIVTAWLIALSSTLFVSTVRVIEVFKCFAYPSSSENSMIVANDDTSEIIGTGFFTDILSLFLTTTGIGIIVRCINISIFNVAGTIILDAIYSYQLAAMVRALIPGSFSVNSFWRFVDLVIPDTPGIILQAHNYINSDGEFVSNGDILGIIESSDNVIIFPEDQSTLFANSATTVEVPNWILHPSREITIINGNTSDITIIHQGGAFNENGAILPTYLLPQLSAISLQFDGDTGLLYVSALY